jgi:hypothetical protein
LRKSSRLITKPGEQPQRIEVSGEDAAWLAAEFQAIGEDPARFAAFVNSFAGVRPRSR